MGRVYGEPVEVRTGRGGQPARFTWRGRRYTVIAVRSTGWSTGTGGGSPRPVPARPELQYWRVEASGGRSAGSYELRRDFAAGTLDAAAGGRLMPATLGARAEFTHLHVASSYSLRYGTATPAALAARAASLGMPALALTDRDGLYGAFKHVEACAAAGIKPLLGVDLALLSPGGTLSGMGGSPPPIAPGPVPPAGR